MKEEDKSKIEMVIKKQKKMGKLLIKKIKKDPKHCRSGKVGSFSDVITLKYLTLLNNDNKIITKDCVERQALLYAKSILEGKELMKNLVKNKSTQEVEELLDNWKKIEDVVYQRNIMKSRL